MLLTLVKVVAFTVILIVLWTIAIAGAVTARLFLVMWIRRAAFWRPKCRHCHLPMLGKTDGCYRMLPCFGNPTCEREEEVGERPGFDSPALRYSGWDDSPKGVQ